MTAMEMLSSEECGALLRSHEVGRLAVVVDGYPQVFPVNYTVVRDRILIRSAPGVKLGHARFERVCFQLDEFDAGRRLGWSVLVKGVVHELADTDHHAAEFRAAADQIRSWARGPKPYVLVVTPLVLSGRRITDNAKAGTA